VVVTHQAEIPIIAMPNVIIEIIVEVTCYYPELLGLISLFLSNSSDVKN